MKNFERNVTVFWWVLAIGWLSFLVLYVFRHNYERYADNYFELVGARSVMHSWWNQDIKLIPRAGYLLNIPFLWLGFNLYGLKLVCLLAECGAFICFFRTYDRRIFNGYLLPLGLFCFSAIYAVRFQEIFDYYSAVFIFLSLGLCAFHHSICAVSKWRYIFAVLTGCCWALGGLSNFGTAPAFFVLSFGLTCYQWRRSAWVQLLSLILVFFSLAWGYLYPLHAWGIFHHYELVQHTVGNIQLSLAYLVLMFVVSIVLLILPAAANWLLKGVFRDAVLITFIFVFGFIYFTVSVIQFFPYITWMQPFLILPYGFAMVGSALFLLYRRLKRARFHQLLFYSIIFCFLAISNRAVSLTQDVSFLFLPVLIIIFIGEADQSWVQKIKHIVFVVFILLMFWRPFNQLYFYIDSKPQVPISVNQYPSKLGVLVDGYTSHVQHRFMKDYERFNCAQRIFLTFYDYSQLYFLVNRVPPFNSSLVSDFPSHIKDRYYGANDLANELSAHQRWCVVVATPQWTRLDVDRLYQVRLWLAENAKYEIPLGRLYYSHRFAWMYVK